MYICICMILFIVFGDFIMFILKNETFRIYVGKQIANVAKFENKEKVRVDYRPKENKIVIRKITKL